MGRLALVLFFFLWPTEAGALTCRPNNDMARRLLEGYGEIPLFRTEEPSGHIVFTFVNPANHTWTRVRRMFEEGKPYLCVIAVGVGDRTIPKAEKAL